MGGVIELMVLMLIIAIFAFAPLGYFIYMYTMKNGEPFGDTEPHGDSDSALLTAVSKAIAMVRGKLGRN
ncbi:MAG: hypothetical protein BVN35_16995 [Proteobacteria bacterium ST_bin11]|jgi:hypothetical protein|nr:MAG: hypothetical protein BVN35_16995 [Proteobacteria bacterium ST_bin11]